MIAIYDERGSKLNNFSVVTNYFYQLIYTLFNLIKYVIIIVTY